MSKIDAALEESIKYAEDPATFHEIAAPIRVAYQRGWAKSSDRIKEAVAYLWHFDSGGTNTDFEKAVDILIAVTGCDDWRKGDDTDIRHFLPCRAVDFGPHKFEVGDKVSILGENLFTGCIGTVTAYYPGFLHFAEVEIGEPKYGYPNRYRFGVENLELLTPQKRKLKIGDLVYARTGFYGKIINICDDETCTARVYVSFSDGVRNYGFEELQFVGFKEGDRVRYGGKATGKIFRIHGTPPGAAIAFDDGGGGFIELRHLEPA